MTIQRADLKIFKPEALGNEASAGGYRSGEEVVSGKLNDVFSSISDVDHARSAFDLVKLFPAVDTNDNSRLQDAYVFISEQPNDPLVTTLIIENKKLTDADKLSDMQVLLTDSETIFHGLALATTEINSDVINVNVSSVQLVPSINKSTGNFGINGYSFEGGTSENATRFTHFNAPATAVSRFTLSASDFIDVDFSWRANTLAQKWTLQYFAKIRGTSLIPIPPVGQLKLFTVMVSLMSYLIYRCRQVPRLSFFINQIKTFAFINSLPRRH
jgi:hypothetical protein